MRILSPIRNFFAGIDAWWWVEPVRARLPLRDGSSVSRPPERHRLAAHLGGGGAWRDEYLRRAVQNCRRRAIIGETPWNLIGPDDCRIL